MRTLRWTLRPELPTKFNKGPLNEGRSQISFTIAHSYSRAAVKDQLADLPVNRGCPLYMRALGVVDRSAVCH